jgi:glutamyl-tRNA synthetase
MKGRFAPSPTGDLHLGNARTALLAWLQARRVGGRFVMRVEDLDRGRVREGCMEQQLADLRWLGLDWDEGPDVGGGCGPYLQSQREDRYVAALRELAARELLFACTCSRKDILAAASAPHAGDDEGPRYPGLCARRTVRPAEIEPVGFVRNAALPALRVRVPDRDVCFDDELQGRCCYRPHAEVGDFVVRRKDGAVAYQLAVAADDAAMGITHVLRGADLLSSTARQLLLYEALQLPRPASWTHVPLLLGADGERLAKRHGAVTLREQRERGVAPEVVIGRLAESCGLAEPDEAVAARELIPRFSLERLPREPTALQPPDGAARP